MTKNQTPSPESDPRSEFIAGWREWCRYGFVDVTACTVATDEGDVPCSPAFRDGYKAAAHDNDNGGGERPRVRDAAEFADHYMANR